MTLTTAQCYALETCASCTHRVDEHRLSCTWCACELTHDGALHAAVERIVAQSQPSLPEPNLIHPTRLMPLGTAPVVSILYERPDLSDVMPFAAVVDAAVRWSA